MSNVYDLMADAVAALDDDATLKSICQIGFSQGVSVYIDQDKNDPPGEDAAPSICFHSPQKSADAEAFTRTYGFKIDIAVMDADTVETQAENVTEYAATEALIDIVERVVAVTRGAMPENFVTSYEYYTDTLTYFPVFVAALDFTFREHLTIGQDPLAE